MRRMNIFILSMLLALICSGCSSTKARLTQKPLVPGEADMQEFKSAKEAEVATTQLANPNQMAIQQIIDLTDEGVHEDVIIDKIRLSNSRFSLSEDEMIYMHNEGVSPRVIEEMQKD